MSATNDARAEAFKRYDGDTILDENTGEQVSHDDWGYAETARQAFIAGAEWASAALTPLADAELDAEITDEMVRAAKQAWLEHPVDRGMFATERRMRAALEAARSAA